jgi:hypothetical protein
MNKRIPYQDLYVYEISGQVSKQIWSVLIFIFQIVESLIRNESFFEKRWVILSGLFVKDGEEIERQLNRRAFQTFLKVQDKSRQTWVGLRTG